MERAESPDREERFVSDRKLYVIREAAELVRVEENFIVHCVEAEWIQPADPERQEFDETDVARLRLILELKEVFGVNEESIPLILHLMDQLHSIYHRLQSRAG